jgi:hypothetical protein
MADVTYHDSSSEFAPPRAVRQDPWYVRTLVSAGFVKNRTQAGYILLGLTFFGVLFIYSIWPESAYSGPDPSGTPDPALYR